MAAGPAPSDWAKRHARQAQAAVEYDVGVGDDVAAGAGISWLAWEAVMYSFGLVFLVGIGVLILAHLLRDGIESGAVKRFLDRLF